MYFVEINTICINQNFQRSILFVYARSMDQWITFVYIYILYFRIEKGRS